MIADTISCARGEAGQEVTCELMGDDGAFVKGGGDVDGGPLCGAEVEQEDVDVGGVGDFEFARGEETAGAGDVEDVAAVDGERGEGDAPACGNGVELGLLAGVAAGLPVGGGGVGGHCWVIVISGAR